MRDLKRFAISLIRNPRSVGAIVPSSRRLARLMAEAAQPLAGTQVLELGPGTGAFTRVLLERGGIVHAVEADPHFASLLRLRFPQATVTHGDAFIAAQMPDVARFGVVVSGLPLRNFPVAQGQRLIRGLLDKMPAGARFVQFSYGIEPPVPAAPGVLVRRAGAVWGNLPPARVWIYARS